jgi:hypothetical protein
MAEKTGMKPFQRFFVIVSGCAFAVSMGSGIISMFTKAGQTTQAEVAQEAIVAQKTQLEQQAIGYEKVLEKEPNNKFALDNLIKIRLEMKDIEGLQTQMDRLIKLYPNEPAFQEVIKAIEEDRKANSDSTTKTPEK